MGGEQQQFFLKWNDFQMNMMTSFRNLRNDKSFTDVTLACEGQTCKAHKMVLSACSPYFKSLLQWLLTFPAVVDFFPTGLRIVKLFKMAYMVPKTSSIYPNDFWANNTDKAVRFLCLMPNGALVPVNATTGTTFTEIKEELWQESSKYPHYGALRDPLLYSFVFVNANAEHEELYDENKKVRDVKPRSTTVKIVERQDDKGEKLFNTQIGRLMGKSLHEFDLLKDTEVNIFRSRMKYLAESIARERKAYNWLQKMKYQFPPRLILTPAEQQIMSHHSPIPGRLRDGHFVILIRFENNETTFTFNVPITGLPSLLLKMIISKRATTLRKSNEKINDFMLKVCGREEYIYGDNKLIEFAYIYESLAKNTIPTLVAVSTKGIPIDCDEHLYEVPEDLDASRLSNSYAGMTLRRKETYIPSFEVNDKFLLRLSFLTKVNVSCSGSGIGVQVGIFHGGKMLCEAQRTPEAAVKNGSCSYEQDWIFDIVIADIPRMARLSFTVYEICKNSKNTKRLKDAQNQDFYVNPLGWVNTTIYDYNGNLKTGAITLYLWSPPVEMQSEHLFNPLGTVVSNPSTKTSTGLSISFCKFRPNSIIVYPSADLLLQFAAQYDTDAQNDNDNGLATKTFLSHVRTMSNQVTRHELHEQERKKLWSLRYQIMSSDPHLLSRLLDCVDWNNHIEVVQMVSLLQSWPLLPPEKALELLDYAYPDQMVRSFAVKSLSKVNDDNFLLYLLQLVQALKHESYLHCDLVEMLLLRALANQRIGHYLFWHLRSEMCQEAVSVRFGLLLEAYCRGSPDHSKILMRQIRFVEKIKLANELVRKRKDREKMKSFVQDYFQESHCAQTFQYVCNPLDSSVKWKKMKPEKCRVMDSKAKPLWLVFQNDDVFGEDIHIIFKNGDDLRQDMLTLQMLRIMDNLWKAHGLDLRMNLYGCVSTDNKVGLIEVVHNADTIANIQKEKGIFSATCAFRKGSLLSWLKEHNATAHELNKAIEEFTYSCAGYSVATFVLGIADRHSDNIMVKRTGQLFHIDFGHILGHYKEKFGFRRERVPFVLTHDFVHVINKGQTKGEILEFQMFRRLCKSAFLILRQHGSLILSLFAMMISTGLPELSSEADLTYLHESLVLHMSEEDAEKYFQSKFSEALRNSWKTSLNWASHNVSKNNRG